jgi:mono/diheme cytochrome c family protein
VGGLVLDHGAKSGFWRWGCGFMVLAAVAGMIIFGRSDSLAQGRAAARAANAPGNADNGKTVFSGQQCQTCHGTEGQGGTGAIAGPQIAGSSMALDVFVDRVRNAKAPMPAYTASQVSDAALSDVYAFLRAVGPAVSASTVAAANGNVESGKRLYVSAGCEQCHNSEGQGGGPGPRLAPSPDMMAYAAFVRQSRQPSNNMPIYTPKVLSDQQLADIYAYLQTTPKPPDVASIPLLHQ